MRLFIILETKINILCSLFENNTSFSKNELLDLKYQEKLKKHKQ